MGLRGDLHDLSRRGVSTGAIGSANAGRLAVPAACSSAGVGCASEAHSLQGAAYTAMSEEPSAKRGVRPDQWQRSSRNGALDALFLWAWMCVGRGNRRFGGACAAIVSCR